uniref:Ubiquitin-like domain-containing protein n=1 Tax=Cyprinus carpio TaxID=7962 RepID=A0A8C2K6T0_CYPCA
MYSFAYKSKEHKKHRRPKIYPVLDSMATILHAALARYLQYEAEPRQCVKRDPKDTVPVHFQPLENSTHASLQVQEPVSPGPKSFNVFYFNGSNGMKIPVTVRSTDTIGKMQQKVLKLRPELGASLNLVYNGKPVQLWQTLSELQVKPGATFITYQKCQGG